MPRYCAPSDISDEGSETFSDLSFDIDELLDAYTDRPMGTGPGPPATPSRDTLRDTRTMRPQSRSSTLSERRNARLFVETGQDVVDVEARNRNVSNGRQSPRDSLSPEPLGWRKRRVLNSQHTVREDPAGQNGQLMHPPHCVSPLVGTPVWRDSEVSVVTTADSNSPVSSIQPSNAPVNGAHRLTPPKPSSSRFSKEDRGAYLRATRSLTSTPTEPSFDPSSLQSHEYKATHTKLGILDSPYSPPEADYTISDFFSYVAPSSPPSPPHLQHSPGEEENLWCEFGDAPLLTSRIRSLSAERDEASVRGHTFFDGVEADEEGELETGINEYGNKYGGGGYAEIAEEERRKVFGDEDGVVGSKGPFILSPAKETFLYSSEEEERQEQGEESNQRGAGKRSVPDWGDGSDERYHRREPKLKNQINSFGLPNTSSARRVEFEKAWRRLHGN